MLETYRQRNYQGYPTRRRVPRKANYRLDEVIHLPRTEPWQVIRVGVTSGTCLWMASYLYYLRRSLIYPWQCHANFFVVLPTYELFKILKKSLCSREIETSPHNKVTHAPVCGRDEPFTCMSRGPSFIVMRLRPSPHFASNGLRRISVGDAAGGTPRRRGLCVWG